MKKTSLWLLFVVMVCALGISATAADTVYVDGVGTAEATYATLEEAVAALPVAGGKVIISADITVGTSTTSVTLPAKSGKVTITSENDAKLIIDYGLKLGSETEFDNIEIVNKSGIMGFICAMGNKLTIGAGVTTSITNSSDRWLSLYGGNNVNGETTSYDAHMVIKAGKWRYIYGGSQGTFNGDATVEVSNITVTNNLSAKNAAGTFKGTATLVVDLRGNKTVTAGTYVQTPTFLADDEYRAVLDGKTYSQVKADSDIVYVDGVGEAENTYATLEEAIEMLPNAGGTVIVSANITVGTSSTALTLPAKSGTVRITSESDAVLTLGGSLYLGGDTVFENIRIVHGGNGRLNMYCIGYALTVESDVVMDLASKELFLYAGTGSSSAVNGGNITLNGGTWTDVHAGSVTLAHGGEVTMLIDGATITGGLVLGNNSSGGNFVGTCDLLVKSGTINRLRTKFATGTLSVTLNGGTIKSLEMPATVTPAIGGSVTISAVTSTGSVTAKADDGYEVVVNDTVYTQVETSQVSDTVYVDGVGEEKNTYATLEEAVAALPLSGGTVIVTGDTTVGTSSAALALPAKNGKVTITGETGAKLKIAYGVVLGSETEFDNIELVNISASQGFISADGNKLTIGENVTTSRENTDRWLTVLGGNKTSTETSYDTHVVVKAGTWRYIFGGNSTATFNGNATVEVSNITVAKLSAANESGTLNGTATLIVNLCGNKTVTATTYAETPTTILVDEGYEAILSGNTYFQMAKEYTPLDIVYVKDGGTGDGTTANTPVGSLLAAYTLLGEDGGEIILIGDTTVSGEISLPECTGAVSLHTQNDAKLILNGSIALAQNTNGAAVIFDLPIDATNSVICGGFRNVTFTENCAVTGTLDYYGGTLSAKGWAGADNATVITELPYTITVKNGTFRTFAGGVRRTASSCMIGSIAAPLTVDISGGSFTGGFSLSGGAILADDVTLNITGGDFACPLYVRYAEYHSWTEASSGSSKVAESADYYAADGDIAINISGGNFTGGLIGVHDLAVTYTQVFRGNYTLNITGGTFADGTVLDATQVKAYDGVTDKIASVTYPEEYAFDVVRFDSVNGETATYDEPLRIVFIGDSITEGVGASNTLTKSYPAVFASLAKENGKEVIVANYGMGAAGVLGTENVYYRSDEILAYPLLLSEADADYYVIALGTNDYRAALYNGYYQRHIDEYTGMLEDLSALPDTKKIFIASPILLGLNDDQVRSVPLPSVVAPSLERMAKAFAEKDTEKYVFVDMFALAMPSISATELLSSDEVHPHDSGYAVMGNAMYNAIFNGKTRPETDYQRADVYVSEIGDAFATGTVDDPTCRLDLAMAMIPEGADATIHICGTVTYEQPFITPITASKLTIIGEGEGAALEISSDLVLLNSDIKFDNLALNTTATSSMLVANYHDVEMTESVSLSGNWSFYAGHRVYHSPYDTEATASSDNDCTITLNGSGGFVNFALGNVRQKAASFIGTYSGKLTAFIGDNYTIKGSLVGAVGQNYLTGEISISTPVEMFEYTEIGSIDSTIVYDETKNTGTVSVTYRGGELFDTVYVDGTGATEGAFATFEEAIAALPLTGGTVIVCGDVTVGTSSATVYLPVKNGKITVTAQNGAKLKIACGFALGNETEFDNIEIVNVSSNQGYICAQGNKLTFGENVTTSIEGTTRWLTVYGGHNEKTGETTYDSHLIVKNGIWRYIYGGNAYVAFNGNSTVEVSNITVTRISAENVSGTFNGTSALILDLRGNKTVTANSFLTAPTTILVDEGYKAILSGTTYKQVPDVQDVAVVYVDGSGATEGAFTDFAEAVAAVKDGGTIIVSGDTSTSSDSSLYLPAKDVTITSENDATLTFKRSVYLGGDTVFENITLVNGTGGRLNIYCRGNALTAESDVETVTNNNTFVYAGIDGTTTITGGSITLRGGTWTDVHAGSVTSNHTGTVTLLIDGATITGGLVLGNNSEGGHFTGTCNATVKSGNINRLRTKYSTGSTLTAVLNGGTVKSLEMAAVVSPDIGGSVTISAVTSAGAVTTKAADGYEVVLDGTTYTQQKLAVAGDVNGDNIVTVADVLLIIKAVLNDSALENADMNGDEKLTLVDVIRALKQATN